MAAELSKYYWWIKNKTLAVAYFSDNEFKASDSVKEVKVYYNTKLPALSDDSDISEIPSQFHQALAYRAIQAGYELTPEGLNVASFWALKFETALKNTGI